MDDNAQRSQTARDPLAGDCTVVHEFVGYAPVWWAQTLYSILVLLSLGLIWVLGFYTVQASLWTLQECPLANADFVCVRLINGHRKLVRVHKLPAVLSTSRSFGESGTGGAQAPAIRLISLLLVVYIYDDLQDTFKQLPGMPAHIPLQIHNARKALQLVDEGADWTILNPFRARERRATQHLYGSNDMSTGRPSFLHMAGKILVYPPFLVQYFDLAYLYYMGYYTVASSLLFVTLISAFLSTAELCKTQQELFKSVDRQRLIPLVQNGRIRWGHCLASYIAVSISDI
ncbi:hypothetical protein ABBQ32_012570 [Trebouxia sp. C0010 RCD-2024]